MRRKADRHELDFLRRRVAFQWDWNVARSVFREGEDYVLDLVRGRIRYILLGGRVYFTLRPNDGFLSPSLVSGERVREASQPPKYRVIVKGDREIKGSILARDVRLIDPDLRAGDEILVVDESDRLIGIGRLRVPPLMIEGLNYGEVARVRSRVK